MYHTLTIKVLGMIESKKKNKNKKSKANNDAEDSVESDEMDAAQMPELNRR